LLETIILIIGITLLFVAAYGDIKALRIPNWLCLVVAVLGIVRLVVIANPTVALYTGTAALAVFAVLFPIFACGFVGGGDAKLLTATILLVGYHDLIPFLLMMSICGAVVSAIVLVFHKSSRVPRQTKASLFVPYGVAIAVAGIVTLVSQSRLIIVTLVSQSLLIG
jgi:prepilin peptidase CpaA